jgi:hypothetical protein
MRRLRSFAAFSSGAAGFAIVAFGIGCAVGDKSDLATDLGMTTPGVDAAYEPRPAQPLPASAVESSDGGAGGAKGAAPDSGAGSSSSSGVTPAGATLPTQGEVLVTEVLYDPSSPEPASEWIEVHNAASSARSLSGLTLVDGAGRTKVIGPGVELAPGAYAVLVRSSSGAVAAKVPSSAIRTPRPARSP